MHNFSTKAEQPTCGNPSMKGEGEAKRRGESLKGFSLSFLAKREIWKRVFSFFYSCWRDSHKECKRQNCTRNVCVCMYRVYVCVCVFSVYVGACVPCCVCAVAWQMTMNSRRDNKRWRWRRRDDDDEADEVDTPIKYLNIQFWFLCMTLKCCRCCCCSFSCC